MQKPGPMEGTRASKAYCPRSMTVMVALLAALSGSNVLAQATASAGGAVAVPTEAELEKLVSPIALYPDDLIGIILPAATNPMQLVQADRFLDSRKANPKIEVNEGWDDAVKSLLNYPEVVKTMSRDLDWTMALGESVVADQGEVLQAIQAFRRKTHAAGNLKTDAKQVVVVEKEVIKIVPADPQVIYVPQYNPTTVVVYGGYSSWGYYPTPYPVYYYPYPPGAAFATGLIWGAAISSAWRGGHYVAHYGGNANININRNVNNINTGNINTGSINRGATASQLPANGSSQWKPNKQPGQVSGSTNRAASPRVGDVSAAGNSATRSARPSTQPAGSRTSPGNAFDSYGSSRQTNMNSARGAASRGSSGSRPPMPVGGGRRR